MALQAIDIHVHPSTQEWLVDGLGELKEATERHFRTEIAVRSVDEMAEEFRVDDVLAVLFGWDAETAMGLPRVPNDFIADCVRRHPTCSWASPRSTRGRAKRRRTSCGAP